MMLPAGHEQMTDAELERALQDAGYDQDTAAAQVWVLRHSGDPVD